MKQFKDNRGWMKSNFPSLDNIETDQNKGLSQPSLQKPVGEGEIIPLPRVEGDIVKNNNLYHCMINRRSERRYKENPITIEELSFLLWMTQGVQEIKGDHYATLRPVPSGGARHPFETYLAISHVVGLNEGIYRYLPLSHELLFLHGEEALAEKITKATLGQKFVSNGAVTFIWSCIPYRGEWRYHVGAHKTMLLDAGHLCQNLYLACGAIDAGTCAIAAYDQKLIDELIRINGDDEFVVYLAPVGKIK